VTERGGGTAGPGDSGTDGAWILAAALVMAVSACGGGDQAGQTARQAPAAIDTATVQRDPVPPGSSPATPAPGADGQAVYGRTCAVCHQLNGQGMPGSFPPLDRTIVAGDKARLIRLVLHGMSGPITVQGRSYNNVMAPWKSLHDRDIAAVLTYVRQRFGNGAGAVTPEEVAAERAATASRTTPWTPRELGF